METWMPGADHQPVPLTGASRRSNGPMNSCRGVVLHVNAAYSDNLKTWIVQGGSMSCHFQINLQGHIYQYIPIDWTSWCQSAGNDEWISVETSGQAWEMLNDAQLVSFLRVWLFCLQQRGLANRLAEYPNQTGLGWHGMGAAPYWNGPQWGHSACPGVRRGQRQLALDFAAQGGTGEDLDMGAGTDAAVWLKSRLEAITKPGSYAKLLDSADGQVIRDDIAGLRTLLVPVRWVMFTDESVDAVWRAKNDGTRHQLTWDEYVAAGSPAVERVTTADVAYTYEKVA